MKYGLPCQGSPELGGFLLPPPLPEPGLTREAGGMASTQADKEPAAAPDVHSAGPGQGCRRREGWDPAAFTALGTGRPGAGR